jgi:hypothetical protein
MRAQEAGGKFKPFNPTAEEQDQLEIETRSKIKPEQRNLADESLALELRHRPEDRTLWHNRARPKNARTERGIQATS